MNLTVRRKLFLMMLGLVLFFVIMFLAANSILLEKYYYQHKRDALFEIYTKINMIHAPNKQDFELELEKIESSKGIVIAVVDKDFNIIYNSRPRNTNANRRNGSTGSPNERLEPTELPVMPSNRPARPQDNNFEGRGLMRWFHLDETRTDLKKLKQGEPIIENLNDNRLNTNFIRLVGVLNNGNYILINTPIAAIDENVTIADKFFIWIGITTIFLGLILIYFISSKSVKPLIELDAIAKHMAKLDFSKKYTVRSQDEIGTLGESINSLSQQLHISIEDLKETNNQLLMANEKLTEDIARERRIDEMRKEFVSNVSHELKSPIALIQGYAEGLRINLNSNEENKNYYCEVIMDEAMKMNKLVQNLLNLSQIESGYVQIEKIDFDICKLIHETIRKNHLRMVQKNIQLALDIPEQLEVLGDYDKIEQVIVNYLNNALNHVDEKLEIKVRAIPASGKVRVSVYNSGKNIPEESLEKIWISFYKVDKARTRDYGGTGLGLSVVKAIMNVHHNNCGVMNSENGVEFWFELNALKNEI